LSVEIYDQFTQVRQLSEEICQPLATEDYVVQPDVDVSPPKWHLAHTTWFFEQIVLSAYEKNFRPYDPDYLFLFNSYYESFGKRAARAKRGFLSRPNVEQIYTYRKAINERMATLLSREPLPKEARALIELGLQHEQQHQELLGMDIKYILSCTFGETNYPSNIKPSVALANTMIEFAGGLTTIGATDPTTFSYDNESGAHQVYLQPFALARRCVTNGEYRAFIEDGGYQDFRHWLSDGWQQVQTQKWQAPLYWEKRDNEWCEFSVADWQPLDPHQPVVHVSYHEAQAFAKWSAARLATEFEWEYAAKTQASTDGAFLEDKVWQPEHCAAQKNDQLAAMFGNVWEWTQSAYLPYPRFRAAADALQEYNSKFMVNQMVLRGGCCATPRKHIRASYRNFFYPHQRWVFSGIRLARDL